MMTFIKTFFTVAGFLDLSGLEKVYIVCIVAGGFLFVTRVVMTMFGGDGDFDVDAPGDIDLSGDGGFQLFSLHGLTGFFVMFGLVGLSLLRESGAGELLSVAGGFLAGTVTLLLFANIMAWMQKLQVSGTLKLEKAVGEKGTVYLNIPAKGTGKARVAVQNRLKVFDAVAEDKKAIKTGDRIEVVEVIKPDTLIVKKV